MSAAPLTFHVAASGSGRAGTLTVTDTGATCTVAGQPPMPLTREDVILLLAQMIHEQRQITVAGPMWRDRDAGDARIAAR